MGGVKGADVSPGTGVEIKENCRVVVQGEEQGAQWQPGIVTTGMGKRFNEDEITFLPPVRPTKIICVHLNYRSRLEELARKQPDAPTYFHKPISSLNGHRNAVLRPRGCQYLNYEGEFAVVIGQQARSVEISATPDVVAGFTVANDFGLHDFRDTDDGSMLRVKGADTLSAVGPALVTDWDFRGKRITTRVNGKIVQDADTDDMIWDVDYLIADLSRLITLEPGDLILTGTPANSRPVHPGDEVEVEVEGLGTLTNPIRAGGGLHPPNVGAQPSDSRALRLVALGSDETSAMN